MKILANIKKCSHLKLGLEADDFQAVFAFLTGPRENITFYDGQNSKKPKS